MFNVCMEKLYHLIGYERHHTRLVVACRYPVPKEYKALPITDQETMEIVFAAVKPLTIWLLVEGVVRHISRYKQTRTALPHKKESTASRSRSKGNKNN